MQFFYFSIHKLCSVAHPTGGGGGGSGVESLLLELQKQHGFVVASR